MFVIMPMFGLLAVNKSAGITSRDAVDHVERLVRPLKAGHAGTLDPLATGVLVICVGQATRLIQYVQRMPKTYRGSFLLGRSSETDDVEGSVELLESAVEPSRDDVEAILPRFLGEIQQRPPAHSAVHVAGRRAYELARRGKPVELAPRAVTIYRLAVRRYEYPELELAIECGSGTYVRAIGRDLATALGTAAVMSALERSAIGPFRVEEAVPLDELTQEMLRVRMRPALDAVSDLPRIELSAAELNEIRHGRPIAMRTGSGSQSEWAAVDDGGELAAILHEKRPGQLWPACNFHL
jgi:tRNA pseudouridine55 synthase